ncbi:hypothetical protein RvY_03106 [Ramazzottius varieornatus]|uniref:Uncharacterized protein n=1 Tax=Ramazzottius varieornatus TaxID=947166 RepID=A0A1D1UX45_RAMVA|nr:hypothetical protein RvY_03106 [Ramazzottius varieornatus]
MTNKLYTFYLTLLSHASMDVYPDNHASVGVTKLSAPIVLQGRWEVALVEFTYSETMYDISSPQTIVIHQLAFGTPPDGTQKEAHITESIRVPSGIYTPDHLTFHIAQYTPPLRNAEGVSVGR